MIRRSFSRFQALGILAVLFFSAERSQAAMDGGVHLQKMEDRVRIEIDGELLGEYFFKDVSRPFLYPVLGPGGLQVTRDWPMAEGEGEEKDHPHHRSFWYAHGEINGVDFWSESARAGKTVHEEFVKIESGRDKGVIESRNKLVAKDGTVIATDERTLTIHNRKDARVLDFEITIHASHGDLAFGDTKEGSFAMRLAPTMRLKGKVGRGHIVNSEGVKDGATWGKRAAWVDYFGPVQGETVGVAIFDHPENPRHPTWWHVRDYGLFAANPFGIHDFEKKEKGAGDLELKAGDNITFRYRVYIHTGDTESARVSEEFKAYMSGR